MTSFWHRSQIMFSAGRRWILAWLIMSLSCLYNCTFFKKKTVNVMMWWMLLPAVLLTSLLCEKTATTKTNNFYPILAFAKQSLCFIGGHTNWSSQEVNLMSIFSKHSNWELFYCVCCTSESNYVEAKRHGSSYNMEKLDASLWSLLENFGLNLPSAVVFGRKCIHLKCVGLYWNTYRLLSE